MLPDVNEATLATQKIAQMQEKQGKVVKFKKDGKLRKVRTK
jgi:hypothetical protein